MSSLGRPAPRRAPLVTYITDTATIPIQELLSRLGRLADTAQSRKATAAVQLRDPALSSRDFLALAKLLRARTAAFGALLFVNDRVDVARIVGADGVHLGRRSMTIADARALLGPSALVSVACHRVEEVLAASRAGATQCSLSPIFESPGKGAALGVAALTDARRRLAEASLEIGLVALGGIDDRTARAALHAGADGVAAIRAELDIGMLLALATDPS